MDLLAQSEFADLAPQNVHMGSLERYEISKLFVCGAVLDERLREFFARYTSVYSWLGSGQQPFVRQLRELCQDRAYIFPLEPESLDRHQSEYYLACIQCSDSPALRIELKPQAVAWGAEYWARQSLEASQVLLVAPGSGAREKNWPAQYFTEVIKWWRDQIGGKTVAMLGPVEEERGGFEPILRSGCKVARGLDLAGLAALVSRANLYIGNDSGVTHMAAALGIPTVALFGPSDVQRWRPQGKQVFVLKHEIECAPCSAATMKSCGHRSCLRALRPAEVIERLRELWEHRCLDKGGGRD